MPAPPLCGGLRSGHGLAFFPMCYGTELTCTAVPKWAQDQRIGWHYCIAPGKPLKNGYVQSFSARMHDELLN